MKLIYYSFKERAWCIPIERGIWRSKKFVLAWRAFRKHKYEPVFKDVFERWEGMRR